MLKKINSFFSKKLGVNKAIAYTSLSKIIQASGGVFTVFFIAINLTSEEQGYYYTFGSILSIQLFFELGLGQIITQYVAYETAYLKIDQKNRLNGQDTFISRVASLYHFFVKWYIIMSILFFIVLIGSGITFFSHNGVTNNANWKLPWIILSFGASCNLLVSPMIAFMEGLGKVKEVALMRLLAQSMQIISTWCVLSFGGKLYALGIASLILFIISFIFIWIKGRFLIIQLMRYNIKTFVSYRKEIFPYQWKIALSWISGYFIFQLFNPVLFAYDGAQTAGKMGMTLTALNGILALTLGWTSTKIPLWSTYISKKEYKKLDHSYFKNTQNSSFVCAICLFLFLFFLFLLNSFDMYLSNRFLPFYLCAFLSTTVLINNIINIWATYLRCHKKEPFLIQAVVVGILSGISTFFFGKYYGVKYVVIGYTLIVLFISFPLSFYIFRKYKQKYHE